MQSLATAVLANGRDLTEVLTQDAEFLAVTEALRAGSSGTIDGAWGSSRALALAALSAADSGLLVVVLAHAGDVDGMADDLRSFGRGAPVVLPAIDDYVKSAQRNGAWSEAAVGRRLAVLKALGSADPPRVLVTTIQALIQPLPSLAQIDQNSRPLARGTRVSLDELIGWLAQSGWQRRDAVELPGEFSVRGGILDVFPIDAGDPLRIEFFGDELESIREFSVESQRSLRELQRISLTTLHENGPDADKLKPAAVGLDGDHLANMVPPGTWFALVEPIELKDEGKHYLARMEEARGLFSVDAVWQRLLEHPTVTISSLPAGSLETTCSLRVESVERFSGQVAKVREELDHVTAQDQVLLFCHNEAEVQRLREILKDSTTDQESRIHYCVGQLGAGFRWVTAGVVALSDNELFQRTETRRNLGPRRRFQSRAIDSFLDLHPGDYVVHLSHGISIFRGMKMLEKNGQLEEHLTLEFADTVLVYVPATKIDLVQKYVGASQAAPRLSKVGGTHWERRKSQVQRAVSDLASDLIDIQAARQAQAGIQYPGDTEWQREFEASFPFTETGDQLIAIEEIRNDMQSARPMDRLLCGDVGYGKTELAMRAAFKTVDFGKQVAVLVPTTVLAQQHLRTFRQRMAEFPFVVEAVSRFQTKGQQKRSLERAAQGGVDVLIGTHRLLSPDVKFHDLGLVIIDEEQRFGVEHKERLKKLRSQVDVLTMTATPIPRTLHQSLLGIRDISNLETPPQDRLAVETRISRFDPALIRHAVLRELNRDGQIYFVHTRVQDIRALANRLQQIVPELRIAIIHGQMPEDDIETGMLAFLERRADLLLATTIIESGLDIPSANTIFINEGDHYGLADLHQLRGRVGRSARRAYCYVLVDEHKALKPDAQRRLKAIFPAQWDPKLGIHVT